MLQQQQQQAAASLISIGWWPGRNKGRRGRERDEGARWIGHYCDDNNNQQHNKGFACLPSKGSLLSLSPVSISCCCCLSFLLAPPLVFFPFPFLSISFHYLIRFIFYYVSTRSRHLIGWTSLTIFHWMSCIYYFILFRIFVLCVKSSVLVVVVVGGVEGLNNDK